VERDVQRTEPDYTGQQDQQADASDNRTETAFSDPQKQSPAKENRTERQSNNSVYTTDIATQHNFICSFPSLLSPCARTQIS
jgi:hypothetical protein